MTAVNPETGGRIGSGSGVVAASFCSDALSAADARIVGDSVLALGVFCVDFFMGDAAGDGV